MKNQKREIWLKERQQVSLSKSVCVVRLTKVKDTFFPNWKLKVCCFCELSLSLQLIQWHWFCCVSMSVTRETNIAPFFQLTWLQLQLQSEVVKKERQFDYHTIVPIFGFAEQSSFSNCFLSFSSWVNHMGDREYNLHIERCLSQSSTRCCVHQCHL